MKCMPDLRWMSVAIMLLVLFPGRADLQTADFSVVGNNTAANGAFPCWWSLKFVNIIDYEPSLMTIEVKPTSTFTTLTDLPSSFPSWARKPSVMQVYKWEHVTVDDATDFHVNVYLAHWEPSGAGPLPSIQPAYPIRLKLFVESATPQETAWRLIEARTLDVKVFRSGGDKDKDVAMTPAFRLGPVKPTNASVPNLKPRRLFRDPFSPFAEEPHVFRYGELTSPFLTNYPGDWYLPFWALYNETSRKGFWFLREDHQIRARPAYKQESYGGGYSPAIIDLFCFYESGYINLKMGQKVRADYAPVDVYFEFPSFIQSGNVLVEKIDPPNSPFPDFKDYYTILKRYRNLLRPIPETPQLEQWYLENWHPAAYGRFMQPVPSHYRDIPLVLAPAGAWDRYFSPNPEIATGDLEESHVLEIQNYYANTLALNTSFAQKPAFYFHGTEYAWCGSLPVNPGNWGPSDYRIIRPNYQVLTDWAHTPPNDGFVMAYVIPSHVPAFWSSTNPTRSFESRFQSLKIDNDRAPGYCYATSELRNIIRDYIRNGALNTFTGTTNTYLDGAHFDGIGPAGVCQDHDCGSHDCHFAGKEGCTVDIDNNTYYGILTNLFLCKMESPPGRPTRVFDQEIPLDCLMDMFDSSPGVRFFDQDNPPFFRMVYGNLIRYSYIMIIFGLYEPWGNHPLLDLKTLTPLKDGIMPIIYFFDNENTTYDTHPSFFNQPAGEPVNRLLRSWMVNYAFLKTIFSGDIVRLPKLENNPSCGMTRIKEVAGEDPVTELDGTEPLIEATAFQYTDNNKDCAAVVLMNWATTYEPQKVLGYNPNHTTVTFCQGVEVMITQTLTSFSPALLGEHEIDITLTAEDLNLGSGTYTVTKYTLDETGTGTPVPMPDLTTARTYSDVKIKASRLTVIKIEPK